MVHVRARKKGAKDTGLPKYDKNSRLISIVVHTGGTFTNSSSTEYVGGKIVNLDWCNVDEVSLFDFNLYTGVKFGADECMRYYLKLKDSHSYKLLIDDADVRNWASTFLDVREMHVFGEEVVDDDDSEDSDYVYKSDPNDSDDDIYDEEVDCSEEDSEEDSDYVYKSDPDDSDDDIYDEEVDLSEAEFEAIIPQNIILENAVGEGMDLEEDEEPDYELEYEDEEVDDDLFDDEIEEVEDEYEAINAENIIPDPVAVEVGDPVAGKAPEPVTVEAPNHHEGLTDIPVVGTSTPLAEDEATSIPVDEVADVDMDGFFEDWGYSEGSGGSTGDEEFQTNEDVQTNVEEQNSDSDDLISEDDVVEVPDLFDERRFSEEDEGEEEQFPCFNPSTIFKPEFVLTQVYSTKQECKLAVQSDAINQRRNIRFTKNDGRRLYAKCEDDKCKWMVIALKMRDQASWQIRKLIDKHTCVPSHKVKCMTSTWLSERFFQRFQSDGGRSVKGFMEDAMHDTRCEVSKTQAYKAKHKALSKIEGDPDAQYSKLWAYAEELRKTNPGSTVLVGTEVVNGVTMFQSYYCCFSALKQGFKRGCRKILGVDGCWLKGKHGGQLLTAVGVDANNNPFPVAFAVVERENQEAWEWFLSVLKTDLDINASDFCFMSDKQKGLIKAMETIFPGVEHRFCVRHLHNNLKLAGFRGIKFQRLLQKASYSTTEGQFNSAMEEMKKESEGCWQWFQNKPLNQWCKTFFQEKSKCDMLLNNVCETFNSNIVEARDKPIITMLEWIRESLMVRLQKKRDTALKKWTRRLCPKIEKIMNKNTEAINDCRALKCNETNYQITCFSGGQFTVDLKKLTCSCRSWQLSGIPCTHSICAMIRQKLDPIDYVHPFYHVETYNLTYAEPIYGMSYDVLWGDSIYIPPLPPKFGERVKRGRKQKKRRLEPFEAVKKGSGVLQKMKKQCNPYKCRKCGLVGHNAFTCGRKPIETESTSTSKGKHKAVVSVPGAVGADVGADVGAVGAEVGNSVGADAGMTMAPPRYRPFEDSTHQFEDVGTQHSQVNVEAHTQPKVAGPTMHQQLVMGRKGSKN